MTKYNDDDIMKFLETDKEFFENHHLDKPIIGITLDSQHPGGYSKYPWYALRRNYCQAIEDAGGIPLPLPPFQEGIERYAYMIDGLLISGGGFDIDPGLYGEHDRHETVTIKTDRTDFEMALFEEVFMLDTPILGICGGMQLINVALGGSLIQHIPAEHTSLNHSQEHDRHESAHTVSIRQKTRLWKILDDQNTLENPLEVPVNSVHHQGVRKLGDGLIANAYASDNVIEGIEHKDHLFCMGVQWHPEFHVSPCDRAIFKAFIQASLYE